MARPKRWYDPDAATALRLIPRDAHEESWSVVKWRHATGVAKSAWNAWLIR